MLTLNLNGMIFQYELFSSNLTITSILYRAQNPRLFSSPELLNQSISKASHMSYIFNDKLSIHITPSKLD